MPYNSAFIKAWQELEKVSQEKKYRVLFLADEYDVDMGKKKVFSLASPAQPKDFYSILLLHYLTSQLRGLPVLAGEWISFPQLAGGGGYYGPFKKRVIDRIQKKYGYDPQAFLSAAGRFKAKRAQMADVSVIIEVFTAVPVLITLCKGDDEFSPQANIHFDKNINKIFCTEDIVVMSEIIVSRI